jgi:hypothetical protein
MKRTIKLTETELKNLIKESVNNIIKEAYGTVQWQHFNNGPTDKEMFNDAIEAIEMSDGQIDFDEWYPAFQDYIDYDEAEEIWVRALKHCGYSGMLYNENTLNEISSRLAYQASDKAYAQNKYRQGSVLGRYGHELVGKELNADNTKVRAQQDVIVYLNIYNEEAILYNNGSLCKGGRNDRFEELHTFQEQGVHNADKATARTIAKWCSTYLDDSYNYAKDWHFWAAL